jgi:hypothetical protein
LFVEAGFPDPSGGEVDDADGHPADEESPCLVSDPADADPLWCGL